MMLQLGSLAFGPAQSPSMNRRRRRNEKVDGSRIERRAAKKCAAGRKVLREEEFVFGGFEGSWVERVRNIDSCTQYRIVSLFSRCSNVGGRSWLKWDGHHAFAASASKGLVRWVRRQAQGSTAETKGEADLAPPKEGGKRKDQLGVKLAGEKR
jgi:hypothetical protein